MTTSRSSKFSIILLHPKYWHIWLGFGSLAILVNLLPYRLIYLLGRQLGYLGMKLTKRRKHIAQRNLELSFPDKSSKEINALVNENFKNSGLALFETGMAWFWPDWRVKRQLGTLTLSELDRLEEIRQGVLMCSPHMLNLEFTVRALGVLGYKGYGVYRPHNNPAYDFIQYRGRGRPGHQPVDRKDVKGMIRALRSGERVFYLPDHDYGRRRSVFVPFFAVPDACTTTGTSILAYTSHCAIVVCLGIRNRQHRYDIIIEKSVHESYPQKDEKAAAAFMNQQLEQAILRAPDQWMWLHKRFKTMEDTTASKGIRYKN